jgi:Fe(3+) dicitrate transport protein
MHASNRSWNLPIRTSYAWTVARFTEAFDADFEAWGSVQAGDEMPYVAPHQASLQVAWESTRCAFDWSGRYLSAMRTVAGQGPLLDRDFTPAVTVWDAGFRVEPAQGWSVRCAVQNVFDSDYLVARRPFGARPGLPRMFRVGVELAF